MSYEPVPADDPGGWADVRVLRDIVVERLSSGVRPEHRRERGRALIQEEVRAWAHKRVLAGHPPDAELEGRLQKRVFDAVFGMGRLQQLLEQPEVENIEINGADQVWLRTRGGDLLRGEPVADSDQELVEELRYIASQAGRSLSTAHPRLHMELPDGSRLAAVIETTRRPHAVIRRHLVQDITLSELARSGTLSDSLHAFLVCAVRARRNIIVTGAQNAGKTTLVRALAAEIPATERFATAEQEYELHLDRLDRHPHIVAMQAREGGSEYGPDGRPAGEVALVDIVRDALRMNLSRIVVGEVRGPEVVPMLDAMTTGDGGSLCTLHARSATDAVERLVVLCGRYGINPDIAYRVIAGAVDLVVHVDLVDDTWRGGTRGRIVGGVVEVAGVGENGRPAITDVYRPGADGRAQPSGVPPTCMPDLQRVGFDPRWLHSAVAAPHHELARAERAWA
ncbi:CpaF family protein [Streptomonospora salina]|uniref:Flp pilus assembly CpaF family ATPase n=1 Tax=Streptomonospora salina TaxID=104205 RepID=A0A841EEA0_9ACTN|nr:ATPase, T2SS/T4P/T4SS family [Streptomonospora salina]MBB5998760.1 Flp pilus assembly CpaF family ATPase [Streptomonospora salina]